MSNSRPLYDGQSIKQDTSEVFSTEEPETCILVVNSTHGTLLCLIEATDADRVAAEQWETDEHLDDIYIRHRNGWIQSLSRFIEGWDVNPTALHGTISIQGSADSADEARLLYDRKTAARQLSISVRQLDRFIGSRAINTRRIGSRVLIPRGELIRFSRADHVTDLA